MEQSVESPRDRRYREAGEILQALGFNNRPPMLINALLALFNIDPTTDWSDATAPLVKTTPALEFVGDHYMDTEYAKNSREGLRDDGFGRLVTHGLAVDNPDCPTRSKNSQNYCRQATPEFLSLVQSFGSEKWQDILEAFLAKRPSWADRVAHHRNLKAGALEMRGEVDVPELAFGDDPHDRLIASILEEFGPRFTPKGDVAYIGVTARKWQHVDRDLLASYGVTFPDAGVRIPDVLIIHTTPTGENWLVAVEAYNSTGDFDTARRDQVREVLAGSTLPLVFVSAYTTRALAARRSKNIAWETDVWVAEHPDHLIHFNGHHLLQSYDAGGALP
jgi:BsuBI/PstI restriction endonuclease domain/BsuBI/PstI restriction endonuclease HTH domain